MYDVVEKQPINSSVNLLYADDYYEVRLKLEFASIGLSFFGVKEETLDLLEKDKEAICISVYNCVYIYYIYIYLHLHIRRSFCILHCQHLEMVIIELIEPVAAMRFIFVFELLDVFSVGLLESSALEI